MADVPVPPADLKGWRAYVALSDAALLAQCEVDRFRASGPGGQKRNKTDSAVRLRHLPTGLAAEASESRSQHENRARAVARLRLRVVLELRCAVDRDGYAPSTELLEALGRRAGRRSGPPLIALGELFDVLEAAGWQLSEAARLLGVSTSAVGRLLKHGDEIWRAASERRAALGLQPLRHRG